jgi:GxxExxY protein
MVNYRSDLLYPELSFQIVGILFEVYNELGYGFAEKVYQKALSVGFKKAGLIFEEQLYAPIIYENERVGSNYFDFFIEEKVILEIKNGDRFSKAHIDQVYQYLITKNLSLGILAYFAPRNIHYKRIVNIKD